MGSTGALEGADAHLRVNHLGTYLLTRLLLPAMLERPPGRSAARAPRIVTVASRAHYYGKLELTPSGDIAPGPSGWWVAWRAGGGGGAPIWVVAELSIHRGS
jgi:hypothetical protein